MNRKKRAALLLIAVIFGPSLIVSAATAIEYGLIAALIAIAITVGAIALGSQLALDFSFLLSDMNDPGGVGYPFFTTHCPSDAIYPFPANSAFGNFSSAGSGQQIADNFILNPGLAPIKEVRWWGMEVDAGYTLCQRFPDEFEVTFYNDAAGQPGSVVQSNVVTPIVNLEAIPNGNGIVYEYVASLPSPVALESGWISIRGVTDETCLFLWLDRSNSPDGITMSSADGTVWQPYVSLGQGFCLGGPTSSKSLVPKSNTDGIADLAQAVWIEAIASGNTQLPQAQRDLVLGAVGAGGYLDNKAILTDAGFVQDIQDALELDGLGVAEAADGADAFTRLFAYLVSIDHVNWVGSTVGGPFEPLFDGIDAVNTLNSDAAQVIGATADPDGDGKTNLQEWQEAVATGAVDEQLALLFIEAAEDGLDSVPALSPWGAACLSLLAVSAMILYISRRNADTSRPASRKT